MTGYFQPNVNLAAVIPATILTVDHYATFSEVCREKYKLNRSSYWLESSERGWYILVENGDIQFDPMDLIHVEIKSVFYWIDEPGLKLASWELYETVSDAERLATIPLMKTSRGSKNIIQNLRKNTKEYPTCYHKHKKLYRLKNCKKDTIKKYK